eukprot:TRINITY_DN4243_c0_g1_i1.p1 TRINITY_DN4243_c0_g1~~TRINITY_DN4243_c0_g1_i1.p1  ORF type:complete len:496 (+),score=92.87 TRINITY_DN4243_c0_g1_i1:62-1489(+)
MMKRTIAMMSCSRTSSSFITKVYSPRVTIAEVLLRSSSSTTTASTQPHTLLGSFFASSSRAGLQPPKTVAPTRSCHSAAANTSHTVFNRSRETNLKGGYLHRLFASRGFATERPVVEEVALEEGLSATIVNHRLNGIETPFRTFISRGIRGCKQDMTRELVITVPQHLTLDLNSKQGPLELFRSIFNSLKSSNMDALSDNDFFSLPQDFMGNPYISAGVLIDTDLTLKARYSSDKQAFMFCDQTLLDLLSKEKTFTILCLYPNEMEVALYSSLTRVINAIGKEHSIFPFVPFYIPQRSPAYPTVPVKETSAHHQHITFDITLKSVLQHFVRLSVSNSTITLIESESKLSLKINKQSWRSDFASIVEANEPFALITDWDSTATSTIVWTKFDVTPDSEIPAYEFFPNDASEKSRLNGCFLLIWPHDELGEDSVIIVEDGFNLLLTTDSWKKLQSGLLSQTRVSIPLGEQSFELAWV